MRRRPYPFASAVLLVALGCLNSGCHHDETPPPDAQVQALQVGAELDRTKKKLAAVETDLTAKSDAVLLAKEETEKAGKQVAEKDKVIADKDKQIKALEGEIADMKKRDAFVFVEISKLHQQGLNTSALDRYRQFVASFPTSPLVADANRAIAELSVTAPREAKARVTAVDPHAAERVFQKKFTDGFATMDDLVAMLKGKTATDVVRLLGAPNTTYRGGTELGYVDKVLDEGGARATLVISFDEDRVATLRVGYLGRPIKP